MKLTLTSLAGAGLSLVVPAWLLAVPLAAQEQQQQQPQQSQPRGESRGGGEGRATPHSSQGPSGGGGGATRSSGGGGSQSSGGGNQSSGGASSGGATTRSSGGGGSQSSSGSSSGGYSGGSRMRESDGGSRRETGSPAGYAVPRDSSSSGGRAASGGSSSGSSGGATPSGAPVERERGTRSAGREAERGTDRRDGQQDAPSYARPREGRPAVGTAVPRESVPGGGSGGAIYVPGGYYGHGGYYGAGYGYYDPWYGYGGYGYYGGYYDPWYGGYPAVYQPSADVVADQGRLRLKVKPREAEVYVDGYFAGIVDEFDGIFQRLHLESGPHRIEIRAPGYETLSIDVMINVDHTTTYEGEMKKIP